jgi:glycosyltransferase involved in cell wall biosynthesis
MEYKTDIVICITSYNRYDNLKSLINQILTQQTKYNYHILLINDGSTDYRYNYFFDYSKKLTYVNKIKNGGKNGYYQTINDIWKLIPDYNPEFVIQSDDDFILCPDFIDTLVDEFKSIRFNNHNLLSLCPHLYSFNKNSQSEKFWSDNYTVDGINIMTIDVLKHMGYKLKSPGDVSKSGVSVGVWQQIVKSVKELGGIAKRMDRSLVYHDNTGGSMMHGDFRKVKMIYTQRFNYPLHQSVIEFDRDYQVVLNIKKKSSDVIPNINFYNKKPNIEIEPPKKEIQSKSISNSQITSKPVKLHIPEKKPSISRITNDIALGKLRKGNLKFGKR